MAKTELTTKIDNSISSYTQSTIKDVNSVQSIIVNGQNIWPFSESQGFADAEIIYNYEILKKKYEEAVRREEKRKKERNRLKNKNLRELVKDIVFSGPCTIIFWSDGTKTMVRCTDEDYYDQEKGILACMAKKLFGNTHVYNDILKEYVDEEDSDLVELERENILLTLENERLEKEIKALKQNI